MRKKELAEKLALETKQNEGAAADVLDDVLHRIIKKLRSPHSRQQQKSNALEKLIDEAGCAPNVKGQVAQS